MFEKLSDADIEAAIAQHDDPDHEDAWTVTEVRQTLESINEDMIAHWDLHQDAIDDGAVEIVHEDKQTIVLADHTGHGWSEQLDAFAEQAGVEVDAQLRRIVISLHHDLARAHSDYNWSAVDPMVVKKTGAFQAGEQQVLREIARRTGEFGSVARAVDTLATETHGWSKANWARLTGRNDSTVSRMTDN